MSSGVALTDKASSVAVAAHRLLLVTFLLSLSTGHATGFRPIGKISLTLFRLMGIRHIWIHAMHLMIWMLRRTVMILLGAMIGVLRIGPA